MTWNDEYTTIICQLFANQVHKGNRPNTHLNSVGYEEVSESFFQTTGIKLTKRQLKNKWDKMKPDLVAWQKLMRRQTGTGWNRANGVIDMADEWWRKAKKDIPGCGKFRKKPLQNEEDLKIMFGDITNDESDHWNPMSGNPIIPPSQEAPFAVDTTCGDEVQDTLDDVDNAVSGGDDTLSKVEELSPSPSIVMVKRRSQVAMDKIKKPKTSTTLVIQEQVTKIANSASSFTSRKLGEVIVQQVMDLVLDCGADYDTNEHFIATELFVKKDQREMFMTLPTKEIRFNWLRRKYNAKYNN